MTTCSIFSLSGQIWHGSKPSVAQLVSEGSPLQDDAVSGLCPSGYTLMPSSSAMSAVSPKGGTACYNYSARPASWPGLGLPPSPGKDRHVEC